MISEKEKQRYREASKCDGCVPWLRNCNAECCRTIFLNIDPKELEKDSKYYSCSVGVLGLDEIRYYKYREVEYLRGFLRFKKDRIKVIGKRIVYQWTCEKLSKDNLCLDHPDKKPEICKSLTLETSKLPNQKFALTDNCLFKYKLKEVKQDD